MDNVPASDLLSLTALITSAHLARTAVPTEEMDGLIRSVYGSLAGADGEMPAAAERPHPAVPVKKSVFPDYLVCLEDGKKLRMLKRHLRTVYGLTPHAYRQRWNLPDSYPMIAPNYRAFRSMLAKSNGLGRHRDVAVQEPVDPPVQHIREGKRGKKAPRNAEAAA